MVQSKNNKNEWGIFFWNIIHDFLDFFLEFFSFLILVGCVMAVVRRFVLRPQQLRNEEEDIFTGVLDFGEKSMEQYIGGENVSDCLGYSIAKGDINGDDLEDWDIKFTGYPLNENFKNTFRVENGIMVVSYDEWEPGYRRQ